VKRHQKIDQAPKSHAKRVNAIILWNMHQKCE
jgi:hypothetical protein